VSESFSFDDLKFWMQVLQDSERTIICNPECESRVKAMVDTYGLGGQITVRADRCAPEDQLFIIDQNAIEAAWRRRVARELTPPFIPPTADPRHIWRITGC
jgi:hypothetical protein